MLGATLTTAPTWQETSASALTRSRSTWSMTAISPGWRRLVRSLVRRSSRAVALTPGRPSSRARPIASARSGSFCFSRTRRSVVGDGSFITCHPARARSRTAETACVQACPFAHSLRLFGGRGGRPPTKTLLVRGGRGGRPPTKALLILGAAIQGSGCRAVTAPLRPRSEEHTSELQSRENLVCRLLLEKKKQHDT